MVIIHADSRVATNLNRFDQIHLSLAPGDSTWRLYAERNGMTSNLYRVQLGAFDTQEQGEEQFDIITKEWALGRTCYDMRIPKAFYKGDE